MINFWDNRKEYFPILAEIVKRGYKVTIPLKGFSMNPWIVGGRDRAVLKALERQVSINDIVLAKLPDGRHALHRVVDVSGRNVKMIGDGNTTPDDTIDANDIIAQAIGFYRKGRGKMERTDGCKFRLYSRIWLGLKPVRRYILAIYRRTYRPERFVSTTEKDLISQDENIINNIIRYNVIKIKKGFEIQNVCGEHVILGMGEENVDFSKIISLNDSSYFIWQQLSNGVCDLDKLVEAMTDEYDVSEGVARADIKNFVKELIDAGVIENEK